MSPPIRDGSGDSIGSIRLGDGSEIAEVRTGAGDVLFSASPIPDSALTQDLVAWYRFEDGDARDYASSSEFPSVTWGDSTAFDGTVDGATFQSSGGVTDFDTGANSGAFEFDGSNDYLENIYPVQSNINGGPVTVMAWVNVDSYTGTTDYYKNQIYAHLNSDNDGQIYLHLDAPDNAVGMAYFDGGGQQRSTADGSFTLNTWHHVAGKYDGSSITPYIDGQPSFGDSENAATGWKVEGPYIGAGFDLKADYYIDGIIDDVRIYNTDLTDQQILDIYNAAEP